MNHDHSFNFRRRQALGTLAAMAFAPAAIAAEPPFPSRPIRFILPFSAGSSTDFVSRLVSQHLAEQLNQPVVVENKPGAAGVIGTQQLVKSPADGYTIGLVSLASLGMVPPTLKEPPYDSVRDFAPLTALISVDLCLLVSPRAKANTLPEFVNWARNQKNSVFLATLGAGTSGHFAGFLFGEAAKIKFEPVHFRTLSDMLPAMISGEVDVTVIVPSQVAGFIKDGKLRALAMNGPTRNPSFPDVPTFQEVGYPGMQFLNWVGLAAPAKTPPEILDKLNAEIVKVTNSLPVRGKLEEAGFRVVANSREEFAATIRKDVVVWRDMVKNTGFTV